MTTTAFALVTVAVLIATAAGLLVWVAVDANRMDQGR